MADRAFLTERGMTDRADVIHPFYYGFATDAVAFYLPIQPRG
ncbi:MAG: hypothetical protein ABR986_00610 [Methanomassiliicoccales archaeon]